MSADAEVADGAVVSESTQVAAGASVGVNARAGEGATVGEGAAFMVEAVAQGRISAPGFFEDALRRSAWCKARWIGMASGQIDPLKETRAAVEKVEAGLASLDEMIAEISGGNFEAVHAQRVVEYRKRVKDGLIAIKALAAAEDEDPDDVDPDDEDDKENAA